MWLRYSLYERLLLIIQYFFSFYPVLLAGIVGFFFFISSHVSVMAFAIDSGEAFAEQYVLVSCAMCSMRSS